jgi:hypothetical protein
LERHHIAYLLIFLMIVLLASFIFYFRYDSIGQTYRRRQRKEDREDRERTLAKYLAESRQQHPEE